jgi:2-polyprenyl-3-methyl-5-hydroxy-6-metoxy-1,4-benzoquinol methylase
MPVPPVSNSDSRDDWETHWTEYAKSAEQNPAQRWRRDLILAHLDLVPGAKLLDVGSGQGDLARDVLSSYPSVVIHGLELSVSGVAQARAKVPLASFHQIDLLSDESVVEELASWADRVVCAEVLEHVDDPRALLRNALHHVAPGARVVVTVPGGPRTAFDVHIGHRRHYNKSSLRALLESAGIAVERVEGAGFPFFNLYRLTVLLRGKRLVDDFASGASGVDSRSARLVIRCFSYLFKANRRAGSLGWQMIAVGRVTGGSGSS